MEVNNRDMHSFRKLQVYTTARELVKAVYVLFETLQ